MFVLEGEMGCGVFGRGRRVVRFTVVGCEVCFQLLELYP